MYEIVVVHPISSVEHNPQLLYQAVMSSSTITCPPSSTPDTEEG
jgi:hypothetical protein